MAALEKALLNIGAFNRLKAAEGTLDQSWSEVVYKAAEFVEALDKYVVRALGLGKVIGQGLDRALSEQCNVLKHEGARIGIVFASNGLITVCGYQLQEMKKSGLQSVERMHKKRPAYSFKLEALRIYANALLASQLVADAIMGKFDQGVERNQPQDSERHMHTKLISMTLFVFPGEKNTPVPVIIESPDGKFDVRPFGGSSIPLTGTNLEVGANFMADGFTKTFHIPAV